MSDTDQIPDIYADFAGGIAALLDEARRQSARAVNALMTANYWEIGRRIVEFEQGGKLRAESSEWAICGVYKTDALRAAARFWD